MSHIYQLEITERQARLLSWACENISRIIEGQDFIYQYFLEQAWEKRCKEATGNPMDKEWDGGWYKMREDAEEICAKMKERFWGMKGGSHYGIHYDESADILWDVYQVIRHQLWLDTPEDRRSNITVDAYAAMRVGAEPLAKIKHIENNQKLNDNAKDIL